MKKKFILSFCLVLFFLSGSTIFAFDLDPGGGGGSPPIYTTIVVHVYDNQLGGPIQGVTVVLTGPHGSLSGITNAGGAYTFASIPEPGGSTFVLTASKTGFEPYLYVTYITSGSSSQTIYVTITLNPILKWAVIVGDGEEGSNEAAEDGAINIYELVHDVLNFDFIWVYGDSDGMTYTYDGTQIPCDGLATESNVRTKVQEMATDADYNDYICFFYNGHGDKQVINSQAYLAMRGEKYKDDELVDDLENANAGNIFVFIEACFGGGFYNDFESINSNADVIFIVQSVPGWNAKGSSNWGGEFTGYMIHTLRFAYEGVWNDDPTKNVEQIFVDSRNAGSFPRNVAQLVEQPDGSWEYEYYWYDPQIYDSDEGSSFYIPLF